MSRPLPLLSVPHGLAFRFGAGQRGLLMLRDGWSLPEATLAWAIGQEAALEFITLPDATRLRLGTIGGTCQRL